MSRILFAVILLTASIAGATTLVPADMAELTHDALAVARGRVAAVDTRWTDDRRAIETIVTLEVDRYLKGDLGSTVQFRVPGGRLGRFRRVVVGAPEFAIGDRVVVFLGAVGPSIPHLVGFSQGVYRLVLAPDATGWVVTPPAAWPSASGSKPIVRGDPARVALPVDEFESRVRALASAR